MISEFNRYFFPLLLALMSLVGCDRPGTPGKFQFTGEAQGTYYAVTYYDPLNRDLRPSVDSLLKEFDQTASLWVKNSMINRVNNNEEVAVNADYLELFRISQEVSEATGGSFDITVGPLVNAWGFGPDQAPSIAPGTVDSLMPLVGFRKVQILNHRVLKADPGIKLDFNAVAQGYSVDLISQFLESKGIENYLVDIGGEVYAHGTKPDRKQWLVGIEKPSDDRSSSRKLSAELPVTNRAVATSGNYRKYYERDGIRYSHTIDPHTGYPVTHSLLSVTVVADRCGYADAYATAFMVMGPDSAMQFLAGNREGLEAYFILSGPDGSYKTVMTEGLKQSLTEINR
ncbi:MAG: FAD:protein FMN transferase [Bacteroidetes bacterium]|nr:MAG: FAD:protein FMN transferase [Bacteroidota bacterium]